MKWIASYDTETALIRPGLQAPPPVCLQWKIDGAPAELIQAHLEPDKARSWLEWALTHRDVIVSGHNVAYDMTVCLARWPDLAKLIFDAYLEDRVMCTIVREKLHDIEIGTRRISTYNLEDVATRRKLSKIPDKSDPWRLKYWDLRDLPLDQWPAEAKKYALDDADVGLELALTQSDRPDQFRQSRADFWLRLASCWGLMTDPVQVERFYDATKEELIRERELLQDMGIVRFAGSRDTKAARRRYIDLCRQTGLKPVLTGTGKDALKAGMSRAEVEEKLLVSVSADACEEVGDPVLEAYARYTSHSTILARVKRLRHGFHTPIQPSFDSLVDTGRTSCRQGDVDPGEPVAAWGAQVQNVHRAKGLRECFHARPGMGFVAIDYKGCELHTVSQVNVIMHRDLGLPVSNVRMAQLLNEGRDVHLWFGGRLLGIDYEEALSRRKAGDKEIKEKRQVAKAADFGFPGGLGIASFVIYAKGSGVTLTVPEAEELKKEWLREFSEFDVYFRWVRGNLKTVGYDDDGNEKKRIDVVHPFSERKRGRIPFTVACNGFFQGLAADMAKDAGFRVACECYAVPSSPLYGCRIVNFIHDELVIEAPLSIIHEAACRMRDIMEEAGRVWCPDVPVKVDVSAMKRWTKDCPDNTIDPVSGRYVVQEDLPGYSGMAAAW